MPTLEKVGAPYRRACPPRAYLLCVIAMDLAYEF